jgi:Do/DeqQ family serine protease
MANVVQFRRSTAILTLVAASVGGGLIAALAVANHSSSPVSVVARADTPTQRVEQISNSFADVIEKASPAVVKISMTRIIKASDQQQGGNPFMMDPFFRQFFGGGNGQQLRPRDQREEGLGSGIIVSPSGYILTNNHVVEKANKLEVTLSDGREFTGKIVGTDPQTDVAVVKISADSLPVMPFANSEGTRVGDLCFAIGNPFGQDHTVTMGIVSAKNRHLENGTHIQNFIQTDAAINPGNSGGALINARGELIGMNTMILTGGGGGGFGASEEAGNIGIGFAVPSNLAKQVMDQIEKNGKVSRGYLGAQLENVGPGMGSHLGLKSDQGAIISSVSPNGPGAKAGLESGDVVVAIDGKPVHSSDDLTLDVIGHAPGSSVTLDIVRNNQPMKVNVTLGTRPTGLDWDQNGPTGKGGNSGNNDQNNVNPENTTVRGITVETLTPDLAQQVQAPAGTKGVVVDQVDESSPAVDAGISRGTVIIAVNRTPVNTAADFKRLMNEANGKSVMLTIKQGGGNFFVVVQPQ